jgi:hypothetical protein
VIFRSVIVKIDWFKNVFGAIFLWAGGRIDGIKTWLKGQNSSVQKVEQVLGMFKSWPM